MVGELVIEEERVLRELVCDLVAVRVDQGQADAIALVIGELSVNSAKHGTLRHGGEVQVRAGVEDGQLSIAWRERSRTAPENHTRDGGQGLRLMQRIVRARRGTMTIDWHESGLDVRLDFRIGA